MPTPHITKCSVVISGTEAALSCEHAGASYHVWLNDDHSVREPLYKNSNAGFHPRKLSTTSRFGAALIAEMLAQMKRDSLFEKALAEHQRAAETAARKLPVHLIVGADPHGNLYFVSDNGRLTRDVRIAASFTQDGRELDDAIDAKIDLAAPHITTSTGLIVITLSAGQLETLKTGDLKPRS